MADHVGVGELGSFRFGESCPDLLDVLRSAGEGGRESACERAGRCNAPGEHAGSCVRCGREAIGRMAYVAADLRGEVSAWASDEVGPRSKAST